MRIIINYVIKCKLFLDLMFMYGVESFILNQSPIVY